MGERKYIIDTDIGDEIDDAVALYIALKQGMPLIGVTTVFRNTSDRARLARCILKAYGKGYEQVPVYAGYGTPLAEKEQPYPVCPEHMACLEADAYIPDGDAPSDAVEFLAESCRKYGKDLTILVLGPMTNLAKLLAYDPEAGAMAGEILVMGGAFYKQYADWNVMCDVEAAEVVLNARLPLTVIGADVTHQLQTPQPVYDKLLAGTGDDGAAPVIGKLCKQWEQDHPGQAMVLHDGLVVYAALYPQICAIEAVPVILATQGAYRGLTLNVAAYGKAWMNDYYRKKAMPSPVRVAADVNLQQFSELLNGDFGIFPGSLPVLH